MAEHAGANGQPRNPDVQFEHTDVGPRGPLLFAIGLTIVAVVVNLTLVFLFRYFSTREEAAKRSAYTLPQPSLRPQLPLGQPVLEGIDLERSEGSATQTDVRSENERLASFGWVNRKEQVVHIPIQDAIRLALKQHKLPVRGAKTEEDRR